MTRIKLCLNYRVSLSFIIMKSNNLSYHSDCTINNKLLKQSIIFYIKKQNKGVGNFLIYFHSAFCKKTFFNNISISRILNNFSFFVIEPNFYIWRSSLKKILNKKF